jgi:hypothetical protein
MKETSTDFKKRVKNTASGRWQDILASAGMLREVLDGKPHPCPRHSKIGFRKNRENSISAYCLKKMWFSICELGNLGNREGQWVGGLIPMAKTRKRRPTTIEKIEVLCRIYRAAVCSGDEELRRTTAAELSAYGVRVADLLATPEKFGGDQ